MMNLWETMQEFLRSLASTLGSSLPKIIAAFVILFVGWVVARLISSGIRRLLLKINLRGFLAKILKQDVTFPIEKVFAAVVYYIIMLFVLIAFFQHLQLTAIIGPLNHLLDEIMAFLPNIISAGILIVVAWVIASVVRVLIKKGSEAINLDEKIAQKGGKQNIQVSGSLANAAYWFVFLLFLPPILEALQVESLVVPVQELISKILTYIPDIFAAAIILLIGWFVAHIVRLIVVGLLGAVGIDRIGEKVGLSEKVKLSQLLGTVVYALILLPVLISALNALKIEAISRPAIAMLNQILHAIPLVFGALIIIGVSYFVGTIITKIVADLLEGIGLNNLPNKIGLNLKIDLVKAVSKIIMIAILLLATMEAAEILHFDYFSLLVNKFIIFGAHTLLAVIILGIGLWIANVSQKVMIDSFGEGARLLAYVLKGAILIIVIAMALNQMGISKEIVVSAFTILMAAIGIAVALAFGLGCKDLAAKQAERWFKKGSSEE